MTTTASSPRDGTLTVTINACQLPLTGELLARSGGGAQYRGKLFEIMIYKLAAKDFRGLLMDQKVIMPKPISRAYTLQPGRPASFQPVDQARSDRAQTHHTGACRPRRYLARPGAADRKGRPCLRHRSLLRGGRHCGRAPVQRRSCNAFNGDIYKQRDACSSSEVRSPLLYPGE